jgi:hypothetical protein
VILDLIPHLFPNRGSVSTLDLAVKGHLNPAQLFLKTHIWLIPVGIALVIFVIAGLKPMSRPGEGDPLPRPAWVLMWSGIGAVCLIVAAYFAVHGVSAHRS